MKEKLFSIYEIKKQKLFLGPVEVCFDPKMRALCKLAYYKHPDGCPNFGVRDDCPPFAPLFTNKYKNEVYVAAVEFDFAGFLSIRERIHPDWTDRALRNPRHWQNHVRAELRNFISELECDGQVIYNPEAMGVNVFETFERAGIKMEKSPRKNIYQVALIASPLLDS